MVLGRADRASKLTIRRTLGVWGRRRGGSFACADQIDGSDPAKSVRATGAMLQMRRLDIGELQRAYEGG